MKKFLFLMMLGCTACLGAGESEEESLTPLGIFLDRYERYPDFIELIMDEEFTVEHGGREATFFNLDQDAQNPTNNLCMARVFKLLSTSDLLTNEEKCSWLKEHISTLPTPFLFLLAVFKKYGHHRALADNLFCLASARSYIDVAMCRDPIAAEKRRKVFISFIMERPYYFLYESKHGPVSSKKYYELNALYFERGFFFDGGFEFFDAEYRSDYVPPYWLLDTSAQMGKGWLFESKKMYAPLKKKIFAEQELFAIQRGSHGPSWRTVVDRSFAEFLVNQFTYYFPTWFAKEDAEEDEKTYRPEPEDAEIALIGRPDPKGDAYDLYRTLAPIRFYSKNS